MIKVSNISKTYGPQVLFEKASFNLNPGERVGLVGRNGHGKTTLFKMLLGQEEPDDGEIVFPKGYRLGHLEQHIHFTAPTVLEEACLGLPPHQEHDAWRAEKILSGLGFADDDFYRPPQEFSGGFQIRLNLTKVLVSDPNLLLLDEPTNYLDILSIRWLEKFLNNWKRELFLITHDRSFMDSVITHTLGIHRRKMRKIAGHTEKYYQQIMQDEEIHEKTRQNEAKRTKEIELFISRFRAKARLAGLVQSRIKTLEKRQTLQKLERIQNLEFSFNAEPFPSSVMLETRDLGFAYAPGAPRLIDRLNLLIEKNDRIGVIGKNGRGKSTLLRLLAGELKPLEGAIQTHPKLKIAYYGQTNVDRLQAEKTIEEELLLSDPQYSRQKVRDICGSMMFSGDMALKKISVLSGGERSRVLMGKLLLSPAHLLLLDEPTNHLDMESSEALLEAADAFDGALVIVTHNEEFLHTLVNKFVVFDRNRVFLYTGTYQDFLDEIGWEGEAASGRKAAPTSSLSVPVSQPPVPTEPGAAPADFNRKDLRKEKIRYLQERSRLLKPLETRMRELEQMINRLEMEMGRNEQLLIQASIAGNAAEIAELPKKNRDLKNQIDFLYSELETATQACERTADEFDQKNRKKDFDE